MIRGKSPFKLIVSDMDGTIFDQTYTVTEQLKAAVSAARQVGCEFTFATGRLYPSAVQFARELGVSVPLITYNGAQVRNPLTDETVMELPLPKEKAAEVLRLTKGQPVMRFVFLDDIVYTDIEDSLTKTYAEALRVRFERKEKLEEVLAKDPIMIALRGEPEEIKRWTECFSANFDDEVYLANSRPFFLDVANARASKGFALEYLSRSLGLGTEEVIAIGDERNDLEMMKVAGLGAAVGNAAEVVKNAAGYVAEADYWRGVIEIIEKFVLSNEHKHP